MTPAVRPGPRPGRRWDGRSPRPARTGRRARRAAPVRREGPRPLGYSTMAASVPSKSRNSALRSGSAASGCRIAGRRARRLRRGQRRGRDGRRRGRRQVGADDHDHVGSRDAVDRRGRREREHLGRLDADGGRDGRRRLLHAGGVVDGRRGFGRGRSTGVCILQPPAPITVE